MNLGGPGGLWEIECKIKLLYNLTHTYLLCGIVSKGTAVVWETPAEEAGRQGRQEEPVSLQDQDLFFQTQYLTYGASRQLCREVYSVTECGALCIKHLGKKVRCAF